ncbi:TetR/AcrR family transcriptional regulator [Thalassotalea sp. HSM 43]|uniref:TetR/AcrR family transcriptional regulator n=1 Tax=Thalassotalea sp. HSM 43 TaxID=2552945 RepID=UPI0016764EA5|nr:TetR family transcriptional regulator [Thalassotalea sp. HSM 43]
MTEQEKKTRKVQQRRLDRQEKIREATIELLKTKDVNDLSLYDVAAEAEIPPSSLYHFYPKIDDLLTDVMLSVRDRLNSLYQETLKNSDITEWRQLSELLFKSSQQFHNTHPYAPKLMLGLLPSTSIAKARLTRLHDERVRDFEIFDYYFHLPPLPDDKNLFEIAEVIGNVVLSLGYMAKGTVTDSACREAILAVNGYLANYFPPYMTLKSQDDKE